MRLTTRTDLALRTLMTCAVNPGRTLRKQEIAQVCNASENHLGQVIHILSQSGFLRTLRGRHGGLLLDRPEAEISVGAVVRRIEGGTVFVECFDPATNDCPLIASCQLQSALVDALEAFYSVLDEVTLRDLVIGNEALSAILTLPAQSSVRPLPPA